MWLSPNLSPVVHEARAFAIAAHEAVGQKRKYTGEPYWYHPKAVYELVAFVPHTDEMLCAAWLHDVVEDTSVGLEVIRNEFGLIVHDLVDCLTDRTKPEDGNRAVCKAMELERWSGASSMAQTIKCADLIDNSKSIFERDPDFAKIYIPEKRALLAVLTLADRVLWNEAQKIVNDAG